MADYTKMTVEALRELARKVLGPGHSKKSKRELVAALERAAAAQDAGTRARAAGKKPPSARPATARPPTATPPAPKASAPKLSAPKASAARPAAAKASPAQKAGRAAQRATQAARAGAKAIAEAGKAAAAGAAEGARTARARARKPGKVKEAVAAVAGAAAGAIAGVAAARKAAKARRAPEEGPDPDGYFVARVRGEDAVRDAPHPMTEAGDDRWTTFDPAGAVDDEQLGELPWGYGDDAFVALPRDPRTLFLYWDLGPETIARGFEGLDHPRVQLWIYARRGDALDRVRLVEFALEARGFYVHDLEPGRVYRAEIHAVDRAGRERRVGSPSNEVALPTVGPSPIVDDRFVRIPWDLVLGRLLGPGHAGAPFSEEARQLLARLSDWSRFQGPTWGSAGGMGGRPFSPSSAPSSPTSPFGGGR